MTITDTTLTEAQRARAGAEFLDDRDPKWFEAIELWHFDITLYRHCVLAQRHGDWTRGRDWFKAAYTALPGEDVDQALWDMGFVVINPCQPDYDTSTDAFTATRARLNDAWRGEIDARLKDAWRREVLARREGLTS